MSFFTAWDVARRSQGYALDLLGFGPSECAYRVVASGSLWRLRDYGGASSRTPVLIIAAPIKRPYIWDLTPSFSAIRYCLGRGWSVYLLEWTPPPDSSSEAGLEIYADRAIADCVHRITAARGMAPFLMGHSLGGTFAAIFSALEPKQIRGLVLLGAPLCFQPGASRFRDAIVRLAPLLLTDRGNMPGSALSHISALALPDTFVWARLKDASLTAPTLSTGEVRSRAERWALDECALPARLVSQLLRWLYQEDRLCRGTLRLRGNNLRPASISVPVLAVVNTADDIAPRESVIPFLDQIPGRETRLIEFPGESGVGLQHLAILIGPGAHGRVWPEIAVWLDGHG